MVGVFAQNTSVNCFGFFGRTTALKLFGLMNLVGIGHLAAAQALIVRTFAGLTGGNR